MMVLFSKQGRMMDIEEFEKKVQPRAKRSRLEPFQAQIFELKAKGYANWQVCDWLAANDLKVSQEAVRKFVKSREGKVVTAHSSLPGQAEKQAAVPQVLTPEKDIGPVSTAPGEKRKINNPADIRSARKREVNLEDYSDKEGE